MGHDNTYAKVYSEVYDILKFCDADLKNKISKKFIRYIYENRDKEYVTNIIPYIPLEKQEILPETKTFIALIYRSYFADEHEKNEFLEEYKLQQENIEKEKREKYNPEDIFKSRNNSIQQIEMENNTANMPVTVKRGVFWKIINKLKAIFRKRNTK